jgi:hypothetical protein
MNQIRVRVVRADGERGIGGERPIEARDSEFGNWRNRPTRNQRWLGSQRTNRTSIGLSEFQTRQSRKAILETCKQNEWERLDFSLYF